tara:strand:+ start:287 stop:1060 length:774 start_codon:yes stop_codon:yes gene_type:complete
MFGRNALMAFSGMTLAAGLSGCGGMPIAGSIISTLADGTGYLIDGRSAGDMMLSEYMGADCTFARVFTGEYICRAHPQETEEPPAPRTGETAVAAVYARADDPVAAMAGTDWPTPPQQKPDFPTPRMTANGPESMPGTTESQPGAAQFLVVGSYRTRAAADAVVAALDGVETTVQSVDVLGERAYRVLAGPISVARREALTEELRSNGIGATWPVLLCAETLAKLPCPAGTPPAAPMEEAAPPAQPTVEPAAPGVSV